MIFTHANLNHNVSNTRLRTNQIQCCHLELSSDMWFYNLNRFNLLIILYNISPEHACLYISNADLFSCLLQLFKKVNPSPFPTNTSFRELCRHKCDLSNL